jgi:hypothetical protein
MGKVGQPQATQRSRRRGVPRLRKPWLLVQVQLWATREVVVRNTDQLGKEPREPPAMGDTLRRRKGKQGGRESGHQLESAATGLLVEVGA